MKRISLTIDNETKMGTIIYENDTIDFYNDGTEKKPIMIQMPPDDLDGFNIIDLTICNVCEERNYVNDKDICYWCKEIEVLEK